MRTRFDRQTRNEVNMEIIESINSISFLDMAIAIDEEMRASKALAREQLAILDELLDGIAIAVEKNEQAAGINAPA